MRAAVALLALIVAAIVLGAGEPSPARGQAGLCLGANLASQVTPVEGAPRLRFGINPAGTAGAVGPPVEPVPNSPGKTRRALAELAPADGPFYVRLNRFFWELGPPGIRHFMKLTRRYARQGYLVELQLRYHPRPEQEGNIDAWVRFVERVVRKFGRVPAVGACSIAEDLERKPDILNGGPPGGQHRLLEDETKGVGSTCLGRRPSSDLDTPL